MLLKCILDVVVAASLIVALAPLFILLGLLVLLEGGFPLIYCKRVAGKNGEFDAYKFVPCVRTQMWC